MKNMDNALNLVSKIWPFFGNMLNAGYHVYATTNADKNIKIEAYIDTVGLDRAPANTFMTVVMTSDKTVFYAYKKECPFKSIFEENKNNSEEIIYTETKYVHNYEESIDVDMYEVMRYLIRHSNIDIDHYNDYADDEFKV